MQSVDWASVAAALANETRHPILVVDMAARILLANAAAERLLSWSPEALRGRPFAGLLGSREHGARFALDLENVKRGERTSLAVVVVGGDGTRLSLTCECRLLGEPLPTAILVRIVDSLRVSDHLAHEGARVFSLELSREPGMELVVRSARGYGDEGLRDWLGQPCFVAAHGRTAPCPGCPVSTNEPLVGPTAVTLVDEESAGHYWVVTARPGEGESVLVTERRLSELDVSSLLKARIRRLAARAQLTPREESVLELIAMGRTFEEIAIALEISVATVKFHQNNMLKKIGADSRLDIMRLLI